MNRLFQKIVTMLRNSNTTQHNTTQHNTTQHNTTQLITSIMLLLCFATSSLKGQLPQTLPVIPDTPTYYDYLNFHLAKFPATNAAGEYEEGSFGASIRKDAKIWAPRVFPSGNTSAIAIAITDYVKNFNTFLNNDEINCGDNANWKCIGPTGPLPAFVGIIHQIRFSPNYATDKTAYICTNNGGLWKSINGGENWSVTGTDIQLPFTSVSDVAIDPQNTSVLYISTGSAEKPTGHYALNNIDGPNAFTPLFTGGVYKSIDGGANWKAINGANHQLLDLFDNGAVIRRIKLHPTDAKILYITTSEGVFRTNNCQVPNPVWEKLTNFVDRELKGLEFKPDNPSTIYVSGRDIYRSTDGGINWTSMTGASTGLVFPITTPTENSLTSVHRINITVANSSPNRLYAHIVGEKNSLMKGLVYVYDDGSWTSLGNIGPDWDLKHLTRTAISVNPNNNDEVFVGSIRVYKRGAGQTQFSPISGLVTPSKFHGDVNSLSFEPGTNFLFAVTDGGVHKVDVTSTSITNSWQDISSGLQVATTYRFDDTDDAKDRILIGNQDCGTYSFQTSQGWKQIWGGDGYLGRVDGVTGLAYGLYNGNTNNSSIITHNFTTGSATTGNFNLPNEIDGTQTLSGAFEVENHPRTEKLTFGFSELFERDAPNGNNWKIRSDLANNNIQQFQRKGGSFDFADSNPDYILVAVSGGMFDHNENTQIGSPFSIQPRLFLSKIGGCTGTSGTNPATATSSCFKDITPNLINSGVTNSYIPINNGASSITIPVITDVMFDPENHLNAWVTFSGYEPTAKVWRTNDGGETWINADPNGSLHNLPVNCMAFQKGTKEGIYIGTDAGIWYKDASMVDWERFCDFPNVRVTELKINYCMSKIRASTWGRSIWEGDLKITNGIGKSELVIDATTPTTWNISRGLDRNLRIRKGSILNITGASPTEKIKISIPKGGYIIVEDGAQLIVKNAILTNNCDNTWKGIEVWGRQNLSQTIANQGYLQLNDVEIEHAFDAIKVWGNQDLARSGGIVNATNSIFRNNKRAIEYIAYESTNPLGAVLQNRGSYKNCQFTVNDGTRFNGDMIGHVTMWGVRGVKFLGCNFNDSRGANVPFQINRNFGILSIDASPIIREYCPDLSCTNPIRSVFKGFNCGINSTSGGVGNHSLTVHRTDFTNNVIGVHTDALNNNQIRGCTFSVGKTGAIANAPETHEGLVLMHETNFTVDNNSFEPVFPAAEPVTVGIRVLDAGMDANIIYRNTFTKSNANSLNRFHANLSNGNNRNPKTGGGLQYLCNTNTNNLINGFDFAVTGGGFVSGIAFQQGAMGNPAENTFSLGTNLMGSDFFNEGNLINYFFRNTGGIFEPQNVSGAFLNLSTNTNDISCQNDFALVAPPNTIKESYYSEESIRNIKDVQLSVLIDGGNSTMLYNKVADAKPSTKEAVKSELVSTSPYLSEKVINKVAERGEFFTKPFVNQIVTLNPDAVSEDTWIQMKNSAGFSDQEIITLKANINTITTLRTVKIQELEGLNQSLNKKAVQIVQGMKLDTLGYYNDSLIVWYQKIGGIGADYQIVDTYLDAKQYDKAMDFLSGIPAQYGLSESELHEFDFYSDIKKMQVEAAISNTILTSSQEAIQKLETIANNSKGLGAAYAKEQLNFALGTSFYTPPVLPSIGTQNRPSERNNDVATGKIALVKAIPNPANTIVRFDIELPSDLSNGILIISDNSGKVVANLSVQSSSPLEYNTKALPNGIYFYQLLSNGKPFGVAQQLVIIH